MKSFSVLRTFQISALLVSIGLSRAAHAQSIETFDPPGSVETYPVAVNEFGRIVGYFRDSSRNSHGFVRSPFGAYTLFDAPNPGDPGETSWGTVPRAINAAGQISGAAYGVRGGVLIERAFVRDEYGTITEFDVVPGSTQTEAQAINIHGWIAGTYLDTGPFKHGFVRSPHGTITTFDIPDSIAFVRQILPNGTVIGVSDKPLGLFQGFVREPDGAVSIFEGPDLNRSAGGIFCGKCGGTFTTAATAAGRSVGYYAAADHAIHGFVRKPNGTITNLDVFGALITEPDAINFEGSIAGKYINVDPYDAHGFLLLRNGTLESFDAPGAREPIVTALDSLNRVIGYFQDPSGQQHGFIRKPRAMCAHFH